MNNWFENFKQAVTSGSALSDIKGAGNASAETALGHYRFQHEAKVKEAIADTFPVLLSYLKQEWDEIWNSFWKQNTVSPRSLDFFPEVFLTFFLSESFAPRLQELARFEFHLEIFPWTHTSLWPVQVGDLQENSRLELGPFEIRNYTYQVTELYDGSEEEVSHPETILLWMKGDSVNYRVMKDWEIKVLQNLPQGMNEALEFASENAQEVTDFFQWLGTSNLIRQIY